MKPDGFNEKVIIKAWEDENPKNIIFKDDKFLFYRLS